MEFKNYVNEVAEPGQDITYEELIKLISPYVESHYFQHKLKDTPEERIFISFYNKGDLNNILNISTKNDFYVFGGNNGRGLAITKDIDYPVRKGTMDDAKRIYGKVNEVAEPGQLSDMTYGDLKKFINTFSPVYIELKGKGTGNGTGEKRILVTGLSDENIEKVINVANENGYYIFQSHYDKLVLTKDKGYPKKSYSLNVIKTLGAQNLDEASEEEGESDRKFKWFIENVLSKLEVEGEPGDEEKHQLKVRMGNSDGIIRLLIDKKSFDSLGDKITKLANKNRFYVFADEKNVAITDDLDLTRLKSYSKMKLLGKENI
jgi:hypothetical protein